MLPCGLPCPLTPVTCTRQQDLSAHNCQHSRQYAAKQPLKAHVQSITAELYMKMLLILIPTLIHLYPTHIATTVSPTSHNHPLFTPQVVGVV